MFEKRGVWYFFEVLSSYKRLAVNLSIRAENGTLEIDFPMNPTSRNTLETVVFLGACFLVSGFVKMVSTRLNSSRMRTDRGSGHLMEGLSAYLEGDVCLPGEGGGVSAQIPPGQTPPGQTPQADTPSLNQTPTPVDRMNDTRL